MRGKEKRGKKNNRECKRGTEEEKLNECKEERGTKITVSREEKRRKKNYSAWKKEEGKKSYSE